jgi:S1-C subfamily serine protease
MRRCYFILILLLLGPVGKGGAQDDPDLQNARALEKAQIKVIQNNENSIACILVSRSDAYHEFDQGPDKDHPGKLGSFDPVALKASFRFKELTDEKRKQWQKQLDFTDPNYVPRAFGSGVVIDADGLILTNYHVVQDATKIFVRLPGGISSYADIHAADPRSDLAVLKLLNTNARQLKAIALGDADKMQRGQFVLTLSNPFAAAFRDGQPSASWGILSNIRRRVARQFKEEERVKPFQYYGTLLQTDARLHLGCSGGAVLNLSGEMVGLMTSVAAIQGDETPGGFAIPVNAGMRRIIEVLKRGEEVDYAFLGVGFAPSNGNGKAGVALTLVGKGSPAEVDGKLKDGPGGDTILAVNGQPIHDSDDIYTTIGMQLAGSQVRLLVRRGNVERIVDITLAKLHVPGTAIASAAVTRPYRRGLRVDWASLVMQQPGRPARMPAGVLISDVQPDTSADRANLKTGDVITHVNGIAVTSPSAFYNAITNVLGPIELTVINFPQQDAPTKVQLK